MSTVKEVHKMDESAKITAKLPYKAFSLDTDKERELRSTDGGIASPASITDLDKVLLAAIVAYKLQLPNTKLIPADELLQSVGILPTGDFS